MRRRPLLGFLLAAAVAALVLPAPGRAGGGDYVFAGGTPWQRAEVRRALEASSFPWDVVPVRVTIHVRPGVRTHSRPGHIWLDARLIDVGRVPGLRRFAWATVQDEYAHQVDFFLFDGPTRAYLNEALGGLDWCYGVPGLSHSDYGCERFASTLVWAYWPSPENAYRPRSRADESAAMAPARFRALMSDLLAI